MAASKRLGVIARWRGKHVAGGAGLHHLAVAHHHHPVADLGRHPHVMGDEQHRQIHLLAHIVQQLQHLRLHRHIQRRHRLIGDQHIGPQHQGARQTDALALATGEFMRKAVHGFRVQSHQTQDIGGPGLRFARILAIGARPGGDDVADALARVER